MQPCKSVIGKFIGNGSGATAIEYGLIAGFLSIVIVAGAALIGTSLTATFVAVGTALVP